MKAIFKGCMGIIQLIKVVLRCTTSNARTALVFEIIPKL